MTDKRKSSDIEANGEGLHRRDFLKAILATTVASPLYGATAQAKAPTAYDPAVNTATLDLPHAYPAEWTSESLHYIWNATPEVAKPLYLRKIVTFQQKPLRAILSVLNDARFALWINEQEVRSLKHGASWRLASTYDVTCLMNAGQNSICIQSESLNSDYHSQPLTPLCGVAAQLEIFDGTTLQRIQTDASWSVRSLHPEDGWMSDTPTEGGWEAAKLIAAANQSPWVNLKNWPAPLPDPASSSLHVLNVAPKEIHVLPDHAGAELTGPTSVRLHVDCSQQTDWYNSSHLDTKERLAYARSTLPGVVVDFGCEVHGRVHIKSASDVPMAVLIALGESPGEMWNAPHTGILDLFIPAQGQASTLCSGFRYAEIHALSLGSEKSTSANLILEKISCEFVHQPVQYQGALTCSDPLLQELWKVGAYTVHLCAQREVWDAPKRDRNAYGGDLHPVAPILTGVFHQPALALKTLDVMSSGIWIHHSILRHINGISGYSAAWIYALAETFQMSGDRSSITERLQFLLALLKYMESDLDDQHLFINRNRQWCFTDWSVGLRESGKQRDTGLFMTHDQQMATHFYFLGAFAQAAKFLKTAGTPEAEEAAKHYEALAGQMRNAAMSAWWDKDLAAFGDRIQVNAMAIFVGALTGDVATRVADTVLLRAPRLSAYDFRKDKDIVSPYYRYYILEALALSGRAKQATAWMKTYYGEMLRRGATTFWENFDPRQVAGPSIPGFGVDWHGDDSAGGNMYESSLCHGWSSAPTSWIMRNMVGLKPATPGFGEVLIEPELSGALWIDGSVATPHGQVSARHSSLAGGWNTRVTLPDGVTAMVGIPLEAIKGRRLLLNGSAVEASNKNERFTYVRVSKSGVSTIST